MLFDKELMFLDNEAYNATPAVIDLEKLRQIQGEPVKISFTCGGGDMAGITGLEVISDNNPSPSTVVQTNHGTAGQFNDGMSFVVGPDQLQDQYMTINLAGTVTAGTMITCGILIDAQTNK